MRANGVVRPQSNRLQNEPNISSYWKGTLSQYVNNVLKAATNAQVQAACDPVIVCDPDLLARHAKACGLDASAIKVLPCPQPETASLLLARE